MRRQMPWRDEKHHLWHLYELGICCCEQVSLTYSDSNDSSSSLTVPDTPPSLRKRLLAKQRCNDSETVTETPGDTLQRKLFCNSSFWFFSSSSGTSDVMFHSLIYKRNRCMSWYNADKWFQTQQTFPSLRVVNLIALSHYHCWSVLTVL